MEALTSITVTLTLPTKRGRPVDGLLREALYLYGLNPRRWANEIPAKHAAALAWLETASLPVVELDSPAMVRRVLDSLCVRLDGKPAAASTVQRKRATFYNATTGGGSLPGKGRLPSRRQPRPSYTVLTTCVTRRPRSG